MELDLGDVDHLKRTERVSFKLNGVRYHCVPDMPSDFVLGLSISDEDAPAIHAVTASAAAADRDAMSDEEKAAAAAASRSSVDQLKRMRKFFRTAMQPDSWTRWEINISEVAEGATPAQRRKHSQESITLRQEMATFRSLLSHYAGRPTEPSSPSPAGDGGTGAGSTESKPAAA